MELSRQKEEKKYILKTSFVYIMCCAIEKPMNSLKIAENAECERAVLYQRKYPEDTFSKGRIAGKERCGQST